MPDTMNVPEREGQEFSTAASKADVYTGRSNPRDDITYPVSQTRKENRIVMGPQPNPVGDAMKSRYMSKLRSERSPRVE